MHKWTTPPHVSGRAQGPLQSGSAERWLAPEVREDQSEDRTSALTDSLQLRPPAQSAQFIMGGGAWGWGEHEPLGLRLIDIW